MCASILYVCACTCVSFDTCVCLYNIHMRTYIRACIYKYILIYIHTRTHTLSLSHTHTHIRTHIHTCTRTYTYMGWLRLQVSFVEYRLFYRVLWQKRPIILRSLLIVATAYKYLAIFLYMYLYTFVYT